MLGGILFLANSKFFTPSIYCVIELYHFITF